MLILRKPFPENITCSEKRVFENCSKKLILCVSKG